MTMPTDNPSDSCAQREAEGVILDGVAKLLGIVLIQSVELPLGSGFVQVDGATHDESVLVEVYARIGRLKGGQPNKVLADATKLLALRRERPTARLILAFADQTAADSVVGWRAEVLKTNNVEKLVVELGPVDRKLLLEAQVRQRMLNAPDANP